MEHIPIFILHGWGSSSQSWVKVKQLLGKNEYEVFTPDLPGFGEEPPPKSSWDLDDYVEWIRNYIEKAGFELQDRFFLLGHSFGGKIAVKFAIKYPALIEGLILVASAGVTPRKKWKIKIFRLTTKIGDIIFSFLILRPLRTVVRKIVYFFAQEQDYYRATGIMREVMKKTLEENLTSILPCIRVPTLIVWGSHDTMTPLSDAYIFQRHIKNSKLVILKGGKHGLNLQMPEKFVETIIEWISKI